MPFAGSGYERSSPVRAMPSYRLFSLKPSPLVLSRPEISLAERGRLVVLSGPSGVGKGTLLKQVRLEHPDLFVSISATTRTPRRGELDGVHYYFLTAERFQALIAEGGLLEWAEYVGNYYGTLRGPVEERLAMGEPVVLEIEVAGAQQVKNHYPEAMLVFVRPPSLAELEARLRARGSESPEVAERRLRKAREELEAVHLFDYQIVNDDLVEATGQLEQLLFEEPRR